MTARVPDLVRRVAATKLTQKKFRTKRLSWSGGSTCMHMLRFHLKAMGHRPPKVGHIRSLIAAKRVLVTQGWAGLADAIDAQGLERIAPAAMLPGDVAVRGSEDGIGGVLVCLTATKMLGWFDNEDSEGRCVTMDMNFNQLDQAWRA